MHIAEAVFCKIQQQHVYTNSLIIGTGLCSEQNKLQGYYHVRDFEQHLNKAKTALH